MTLSPSADSQGRPDDQQPLALITTTVPVTLDKFFREHLRQLHDAGYRLTVVSTPGDSLNTLVGDMPFVRVVALPMIRQIAFFPDLRALLHWIQVLVHLRPAVVIAMTPKASLLSMLAAKLVRVRRRIYTSGGLRLERESGWRLGLLTFMERLTCAASTEVVVNSPSLRRAYVTRRLVKSKKVRCTVPASSHGVDTEHFRPGAASVSDVAELGLARGIPVVGFIGRITSDKGIPALIEACNKVNSIIPIQLLIVGPADEPDSTEMYSLVNRASCSVVLTGPVSDIRPHLTVMAVNVLPSLREGFPNVVLEAAGMGIPSIVTDATGCVDSVVDGVTGIIVPVNNVDALARAMVKILDDHALRELMGRAARARAVELFQPSDVVRSSLSITDRTGGTA